MIITAVHSRMARAALGWSTSELAKQARVGVATVNRFETGQTVPNNATLSVIQRAFEEAGIEFSNGDGFGVRLRKGTGGSV